MQGARKTTRHTSAGLPPAALDREWGVCDDFLLMLAAVRGASVLHLACGTGALSVALAKKGAKVVAVDRNPFKLQRAISNSRAVTWIGADMRTVDLPRKFDFIILGGLAFHHLTTDTDQVLLLQTIAHHLKPSGRFSFGIQSESAKPWERWGRQDAPQQLATVSGNRVSCWPEITQMPEDGRLHFDAHYDHGDSYHVVSETRRYVSKEHLADLAKATGLRIDNWHGDWSGEGACNATPHLMLSGSRRCDA
ncbi:class I SAM-dependent methyltransferase [Polycladidibacter hongkongensis]|uniref:class I SAM-dependent methyltransferase n=1 Tax=Polycladidibacter hongkongensis TaxID=1647556 RepID=UPI00155F3BA3|nr:class I SAM-dependent methyltransferase [Pseudovibrio hongkongensis]